MENKRELAKIAIAALILASATPVNGQADMNATGIILAAGCAAHGCASASSGSYSSSSNQNMAESDESADDSEASNFSSTLSESQLLSMLNAQGKAIYQGLDAEGKSLALQLASQNTYRDKNLAVKEAQRRMSERSKAPAQR